jgi:hypothetical protein
MGNWSDRMKLFAVLSSAKVLLEAAGKNDGWSFETAGESLQVINDAIAFFLNPADNKLPEDISMQFAPTGPLQEIAISNGWSEMFLKLAEQYDKCSHSLTMGD